MLVEDLAGEPGFHLHHRLVIDLFERVELVPRRAELLGETRRHRVVQIVDPQIERMQREHADGRIRIGIPPVVRRGGVVDRQDLDQLETHALRPVRQRLEVRELADAEAFRAAQREDRHCDARAAKQPADVAAVAFIAHLGPLGGANKAGRQNPVFAGLETHGALQREIEQAVFVFDVPVHRQIEVFPPDIGCRFHQRDRGVPAPAADLIDTSNQARHLPGRYRRHPQLEPMVGVFRGFEFRERPAGGKHREKGVGLERVIHRAGRAPRIEQQQGVVSVEIHHGGPWSVPLFELHAVGGLAELIVVFQQETARPVNFHAHFPLPIVDPVQRHDLVKTNALFIQYGRVFQPKRLTGNGVIIQAENDVHGLRVSDL